jgi:hypothetical protein
LTADDLPKPNKKVGRFGFGYDWLQHDNLNTIIEDWREWQWSRRKLQPCDNFSDECGTFSKILNVTVRRIDYARKFPTQFSRNVIFAFYCPHPNNWSLCTKGSLEQAQLKRTNYNESATKYDSEKDQQIVGQAFCRTDWRDYYWCVWVVLSLCYFASFLLLLSDGRRLLALRRSRFDFMTPALHTLSRTCLPLRAQPCDIASCGACEQGQRDQDQE